MNSTMKNKCSACDYKSSDIDEMIMHLNDTRHDDELFATLTIWQRNMLNVNWKKLKVRRRTIVVKKQRKKRKKRKKQCFKKGFREANAKSCKRKGRSNWTIRWGRKVPLTVKKKEDENQKNCWWTQQSESLLRTTRGIFVI